MPKKMEQTFDRELRFVRKTKLRQYLTEKIKRTILTNNILEWKESSGGKLETRMGSKPRR